MEIKERIFHIISNTHWDREWRFPFQRNRQMLVEMLDKVLEVLETEPEYKAFHLDSQSILLEDYLEIRPEKKELIKKFVIEKRLFIGPWYVLPDEFLVGGENLIRNLLLGHKTCKEFGRVSKVGYSPFSWGQISQLPQIYNGFGIDVIMFYRGVNSIDSPKAEFIWEGVDGTKALASRFSTMPRYNFYFYIYRPVIFNEFPKDIEYKWQDGGVLFHFADKEMFDEDYFLIKSADTYFQENIIPQVKKIIKDQADDFTTPNVIWMEGHDSSGPNIKTIRIIKDIKTLLPELNVIHSTLEDYVKSLKQSINYNKLSIVKGERRSSQYDLRSGNLYGYTTSARMYLKQENFRAERWLQFYAESFLNITNLLGGNLSHKYIDTAWKYLIQNSAHDSIGGCSLDEIHEDMMCRYKQIIEISKGVFERACKFIALNINTKTFQQYFYSSANKQKIPNGIYLIAINPTTYQRNEVVEAFIEIPQEFDNGNFELVDQKGEFIQTQIKEVKYFEPVLEFGEGGINRPMYLKMKRYHSYLNLKDLPSFGYKTFAIIPTNFQKEKEENIAKNENGYNVLENEYLKLRINKNGTVNVFDKINSKHYRNLAYFYDEGEAGHAWAHIPVKPFVTTLNEKPKVKLIENGSLSASYSIEYKLKVPHRKIDIGPKKASSNIKTIKINLIVTLKKGARRIESEIKVNNQIENHRLRLMFPTSINANYHYAEGQFDVVQRPIRRIDSKNWVEQPMYDFPLHNFVDVSDDKLGCAILVDGIKEYEVLDDDKRTIAITLFRAFTNIIQPSSIQDYSYQKGSQCLGEQVFRLAFYPHSNNWIEGNVYEEALNFNNSIKLFQIGKSTYAPGKLTPSNSFMSIHPKEIILSCLKKAENENSNSFVLRIYNPTDKNIIGSVTFSFNIKKAWIVTLEENIVNEMNITEQKKLNFEVKAKKILSLKLKL